MNDIKTCNIVSYVFECMGYKKLSEHALKADHIDLDSYIKFIKSIDLGDSYLNEIVSYFL